MGRTTRNHNNMWRSRLGSWGVLGSTAILCLTFWVPTAFLLFGTAGVQAAGLACLVCGATSWLGNELQYFFRDPVHAMNLAIAALMCRMAAPLGMLLASVCLRGSAASWPLAISLLTVYPIFLVVDTWLTVRHIETWSLASGGKR